MPLAQAPLKRLKIEEWNPASKCPEREDGVIECNVLLYYSCVDKEETFEEYIIHDVRPEEWGQLQELPFSPLKLRGWIYFDNAEKYVEAPEDLKKLN